MIPLKIFIGYYLLGIIVCIATTLVTKHAVNVLKQAQGRPWKSTLAVLVIPWAWPLILYLLFQHIKKDDLSHTTQSEQEVLRGLIEKNLEKKLSISEIEALETISDPEQMCPNQPFGFLYQSWSELKAAFQNGDQLHAFSFIHDERLLQGYALVRGIKVISHIFT